MTTGTDYSFTDAVDHGVKRYIQKLLLENDTPIPLEHFTGPVLDGFSKAFRQRDELSGYIAKLEEKLDQDHLTQLHNEKSLKRHLKHLLLPAPVVPSPKGDRRAAKNNEAVSIVFIDANDFGEINKQLGFLAGNIGIQAIAGFFKDRLRSGDEFIARPGGDEFVITMHCPPEEAQAKLEALTEEFSSEITKIFTKDYKAFLKTMLPNLPQQQTDIIAANALQQYQSALAHKYHNPELEKAEFTLSLSFGVRSLSDVKGLPVDDAVQKILSASDEAMQEKKRAHKLSRKNFSPSASARDRVAQERSSAQDRPTPHLP